MPKIFTIWPFSEKLCWTLVYSIMPVLQQMLHNWQLLFSSYIEQSYFWLHSPSYTASGIILEMTLNNHCKLKLIGDIRDSLCLSSHFQSIPVTQIKPNKQESSLKRVTDAIGKETYIIKIIPQLHIEEKLHKEVLFKSLLVYLIQDSQII